MIQCQVCKRGYTKEEMSGKTGRIKTVKNKGITWHVIRTTCSCGGSVYQEVASFKKVV